MFGATSSSRPPADSPPPKGSNWPSTLVEKKAITEPSSAPVSLAPRSFAAWRSVPEGTPSRYWRTFSTSGDESVRITSRLALTQPRESTTSTGRSAAGTSRPVKLRTCSSAARAQERNSATARSAPARETAGPGLASPRAVALATCQSMSSSFSTLPRYPDPGVRMSVRTT